MDRRTFCRLGGLMLTGFAGCLGSDSATTDTPIATDSSDTPASSDDNTPADSTERPWPASEPVDDSAGVHSLFVENHTETTEVAWIRIVDADGTTRVDGRYELPDGRAIEFSDLAAWERTYTVDIAFRSDTVRSFEWVTAECSSDSEAGGGGSRNGAVRLEDPATEKRSERLSFRRDQCDAIITGTLPAGAAESFENPPE